MNGTQRLNTDAKAMFRPQLPEKPPEKHPHIPARRILDRIVLGGSDGTIESAALLSALNGARIPFHTILLAGFAFAAAGSVSMFFSSYLATRSELDALRIDVERERMEIETEPEEERTELEGLLKKDGYSEGEVAVIMGRLVRDKELWLREQLRHELRLHMDDLTANNLGRPVSAGASFFMLALLTLVPYTGWLGNAYAEAFAATVAISIMVLFVLGSKLFTLRHFNVKSGLESAAIGGLAAGLLYFVGTLTTTL